jgi:hypothetical protein
MFFKIQTKRSAAEEEALREEGREQERQIESKRFHEQLSQKWERLKDHIEPRDMIALAAEDLRVGDRFVQVESGFMMAAAEEIISIEPHPQEPENFWIGYAFRINGELEGGGSRRFEADEVCWVVKRVRD